MAEALGIVASLAARIQLAQHAGKFGAALYRFSKNAGTVMEEIQNFANSAGSFSQLVFTSEVSLRKHCREHSSSDVLAYIARYGVLDGVAQQSDDARRGLINTVERLRSDFRSRFAVVVFIKWTYHKDLTLALFPATESIKVGLQVIFSIATLETMNMGAKPEPSKLQADEKDERDDEIRCGELPRNPGTRQAVQEAT
ncbi:hypothetical protein ACJ41O_009097 [Fusarium nematophilum]